MARKPSKPENGTTGGAVEPVEAIDGGAVEIGATTGGNEPGVNDGENGPREPSPSSAADPNATAARAKRGRPALTDAQKAERLALKQQSQDKPRDARETGKALAGYHALLAMAIGIPELAIPEAAAVQLSKAYGDICERYGISKLPRDVELWLALVTASGVAYGPVIGAVYKRKTGHSVMEALQGQPRPQRAPSPLAGGLELGIVPAGKPSPSNQPGEIAPPGVVVFTTGPKPNTADGRYKL